jgi:hypothetical protein
MARIAIADVAARVEQQRQLALRAPVLVVAGDAAAAAARPHAAGVAAAAGNPALFAFAAPGAAPAALAAAVPRTAVFFFFRSDSAYQEYWFDRAIAPALRALPAVDAFKADVAAPAPADAARLAALAVDAPPCALVFRLGHLIGRILPERENPRVAAQVAEYRRALRARVAPPPALPLADRDADARAFENREREKEAQQRRREWQENARYRQEVERQLEDAKRERQAREKR